MATDTKFLEKHGNQWRVQVKVPHRLRAIMGKPRLVEGLKTDSLARARLLRWPVVAKFKALIAEAERSLTLANGSASTPLAVEASEYLAAFRQAERNPQEAQQMDERGEVIADGPTVIRSLVDDRALEIERAQGAAQASSFVAMALGRAVPITQYVDDFFAESTMKVRQVTDYKRAVLKFDAWLLENDRPATIQAVTGRVAGEYVSKALVAKKVNRRTINKDVSCLSSYWRWLKRKDHAELNPWLGQTVAEPARPQSECQRPFTADELATLFNGGASVLLHDFMLIAALSGMRIGEIAALRVQDAAGGVFNVRRSKSRAGERKVPIHSGLKSLVERRCEGKTPDTLLFSDLPPYDPAKPQEQASPVTKAFVRYRRKLKVDEVPEGQRRSLIDFHSFRRWFAQTARNALDGGAQGFSHWTIAEVMGHETEAMPLGMTMHYAGGSKVDAKRACVEAVRLPEACTLPNRSAVPELVEAVQASP